MCTRVPRWRQRELVILSRDYAFVVLQLYIIWCFCIVHVVWTKLDAIGRQTWLIINISLCSHFFLSLPSTLPRLPSLPPLLSFSLCLFLSFSLQRYLVGFTIAGVIISLLVSIHKYVSGLLQINNRIFCFLIDCWYSISCNDSNYKQVILSLIGQFIW